MSNIKDNTIGQNIKTFRLEKNLSQQQLAEKVFVTKSTISKWESGIQVPSIESLRWLSNIFVKPIYLILGEKPRTLRDKTWSRFGQSIFYISFWWVFDLFIGLQALLGSIVAFIVGITLPFVKPITVIVIDAIHFHIDAIEVVKIMGYFLSTPLISIIFIVLAIALLKFFLIYVKFSNKVFWNLQVKTISYKFKMPKIPGWVIRFLVSGVIVGVILLVVAIALVAKDNSWKTRMW